MPISGWVTEVVKKHLNDEETHAQRRTRKWRPRFTATVRRVSESSRACFDNCSEPVPGACFLFFSFLVGKVVCVCVCMRTCVGERDLSLHSLLWYVGCDGAKYIVLQIICSFSSGKNNIHMRWRGLHITQRPHSLNQNSEEQGTVTEITSHLSSTHFPHLP